MHGDPKSNQEQVDVARLQLPVMFQNWKVLKTHKGQFDDDQPELSVISQNYKVKVTKGSLTMFDLNFPWCCKMQGDPKSNRGQVDDARLQLSVMFQNAKVFKT